MTRTQRLQVIRGSLFTLGRETGILVYELLAAIGGAISQITPNMRIFITLAVTAVFIAHEPQLLGEFGVNLGPTSAEYAADKSRFDAKFAELMEKYETLSAEINNAHTRTDPVKYRLSVPDRWLDKIYTGNKTAVILYSAGEINPNTFLENNIGMIGKRVTFTDIRSVDDANIYGRNAEHVHDIGIISYGTEIESLVTDIKIYKFIDYFIDSRADCKFSKGTTNKYIPNINQAKQLKWDNWYLYEYLYSMRCDYSECREKFDSLGIDKLSDLRAITGDWILDANTFMNENVPENHYVTACGNHYVVIAHVEPIR